jgi:hypothetical protein
MTLMRVRSGASTASRLIPGVPSTAVTTVGMPSWGSWFRPSALPRYAAFTSMTDTRVSSSARLPLAPAPSPYASAVVDTRAIRSPTCAHTRASLIALSVTPAAKRWSEASSPLSF